MFITAGSATAKESKIRAKVWNDFIVNRSQELLEWSEILGKVHKRKIQIYTYANNHYAVYAPPIVEMFQKPWRRQVNEETKRAEFSDEKEMTLFPMWAFGSSLRPAAYGPKLHVDGAPKGQKNGAAGGGLRSPTGVAGASKVEEVS
jgi:hypothetical protein